MVLIGRRNSMPMPPANLSAGAARPMVLPRRVLRASIVAVLSMALLLLGGCSLLRFSYNQADWLVFNWLDRYAKFDDAQALRAREAIDAWFVWHRRTQLPDYAELLLRIDAELSADTSAERVCGWWGEVRARIDCGLEHAVPAIADLASTLTPAQLESIERRYVETNAEYREEYLQTDRALRAGEWAKRAISRSETLYGDLNLPQRDRLARWMAESPFDPSLSFDERRHRQQDALHTLRLLTGAPVDRATAQAQVRGWLQRLNPSPHMPHRLYAERVVQYNCRAIADLHNSTSAAQRQAASNKLRGWASDLRALSGATGAS